MASAASARKGGLAPVKVKRIGIGLINKPVCRPGVVLVLTEFKPKQVTAAIGAAVYVHIPLITLIDPTLARKLLAAVGTGEIYKLGVGESLRFADISGENQMLQRFGTFVFSGLLLMCVQREHS